MLTREFIFFTQYLGRVQLLSVVNVLNCVLYFLSDLEVFPQHTQSSSRLFLSRSQSPSFETELGIAVPSFLEKFSNSFSFKHPK